MAAEKIVLSPEQEEAVLKAFNESDNKNVPSIDDLVKVAFPNAPASIANARTKEGRAVKELLATKGLKARIASLYQPKEKLELTDSQKEFCKNNANMPMVEIARCLFNNPNLTNLNLETRTIGAYVASLDLPKEQIKEAQDVPNGEYRPPRTLPGVWQRVDKYIFNHKIDKDEMTAQQRAGLTSLLNYMNTFRFVHQINLYESQVNRDLYESSFVRYAYNKADLTEEEVDQYIVLSHEAVNSSSIQKRIEKLQLLMEQSTGEEKAKISMSLVEAINTLQVEYNQCVSRQQKLLDDLTEKRSDRIAEQRSANASILNLIQLWKEEKTRKKLLHLAEARKKVVQKAGEELTGMSEMKARIMGISLDETING